MSELLKINGISKTFGGIKALNKLSFTLKQGEILGLIGPNGAGKSTLFNAIMNVFPKDEGSISFNGINITKKPTAQIARLGINRTFQDAKPLPQITLAENLDLAFSYKTPVNLISVFSKNKDLKNEQQAHLVSIKELLKEVGLHNKLNSLAADLSYGQGKLLEILKVMVSDADLILLDEPFSGLFPEMIKTITELIYRLSKSGKTIMLVEHNMQLIKQICTRVIVMDAGRKIADGPFGKVTAQPDVIESYLGQ